MSHHVYATLNVGEFVRIGLGTDSGSCVQYRTINPDMGGAYAAVAIRAYRDGVASGFDAVQDDVPNAQCDPEIMFHVEGEIATESQFFAALDRRYLESVSVDLSDPELGKREG